MTLFLLTNTLIPGRRPLGVSAPGSAVPEMPVLRFSQEKLLVRDCVYFVRVRVRSESRTMSRRNYDYKDYTKEGMTKLENEFRSDEQNTTPNNPFILRWQEKIKKKLINTSQSRSTKEEKELRQKHVDEIYAEWVKANKEGTPKTPSLRNIRKVVDQDMEDDARATYRHTRKRIQARKERDHQKKKKLTKDTSRRKRLKN